MKYGIFSCSPRANGNSDFCAELIYKQILERQIPEAECFFPCRKNLAPCIACGFCDNGQGKCALALHKNDSAAELYHALFQLDKAIFIVPMYFYHVPANFKAFLDRAQAWYAVPDAQKPARHLGIDLILLGAREKGNKLFEGAKLSIQYAMHCIGAKIETCLCLYGLDKPDDLAKNSSKQQEILDTICSNHVIL